MGSPRIRYTLRPDASPQAELHALVSVYRFILFESFALHKRATGPTQPDTGEYEKNMIRRKEADMT